MTRALPAVILVLLVGCATAKKAAPEAQTLPEAEAPAANLPELTTQPAPSCGDKLEPGALNAKAAWLASTEGSGRIVGVQMANPDRLGGRLSGTPWLQGCAKLEHLGTHPVEVTCLADPAAPTLLIGFNFACADGLYTASVTTQLDRAKKDGEALAVKTELQRVGPQ